MKKDGLIIISKGKQVDAWSITVDQHEKLIELITVLLGREAPIHVPAEEYEDEL